MIRLQSSTQGIATVAAVLVCGIIAIIGGTGYYVWHAKQISDKNATSPGSAITVKATTINSFADCKKAVGSKLLATFPEQCVTKAGTPFTDTSQSTTTQQYLTIKEWGVRMTLPAVLEDAYYAFPSGPTYAFLSLKGLVKLAPDCAPNKVSLGLIFRQSNAEYQTALVDQQQNGTNIGNITGNVQIGDYHYGFTHPQAGCFDDSNIQAATIYNVANPSLTFPEAEKTLEAIPGT